MAAAQNLQNVCCCIRYYGIVVWFLSETFAYRRQIKVNVIVNYKRVWAILISSVKSGVSLRKYESEMVL